MPVTLRELGSNIEANAVDETDNVHGGIEGLGEVKQDANGAAKLGAEGPGYQVIGAAAFHLAVGSNGGQGEGSEQVDGVGKRQEA